MMIYKRVFFEYELPVPYKGISILYEAVEDVGFGGYDVYIAHRGTIYRICPAHYRPSSALDALEEHLDWVLFFEDLIKRTDPEGALALERDNYFFPDDETKGIGE